VALSELEPKPLVVPLRLIVVSRLAPNKRVDHSIRAMKCLVDWKVEAGLETVGTGGEEPPLRQLVRTLNLADRISFTGPLPEVEKDRRLRQAHYLLHTSQREGWGLNVIEANAMGTPSVVYPVPGLVESTLHDRTGLVAEAETPESLATSLVNSLRSPEKYQQYRRNAWERAKTLHWDVVLPKACAWLEKQARGPSRWHRTSFPWG
jgi:glycosyltransferase involved in cell wall biosynthesis